MSKLTMVAIGAIACSMMTGCLSSAVTKGGSYANLPDPKPDEYQIHWENEPNIIEATATVYGGPFGIFAPSDNAPWMLRDQETFSFMGMIRKYTDESKARNAALYKACQIAKCDALIGAMYEVETEDYYVFSKTTCKVRGWPARITGIEKVANKGK